MPGGWWRVKGSVYLTLGVLLLLAFALGIVIGVAYRFGEPYYDPGVLPIMALVCTPTSLVPGLVLVLLGIKARRREKELIDFSAWIKTYRRIGLDELARKLGKPGFEAEGILVDVVDRGLVKGFIDRATNEFVLQEAVGQEVYVETCPRCGANLQRRFFQGETVQCPYCHSVISGPGVTKPT